MTDWAFKETRDVPLIGIIAVKGLNRAMEFTVMMGESCDLYISSMKRQPQYVCY